MTRNDDIFAEWDIITALNGAFDARPNKNSHLMRHCHRLMTATRTRKKGLESRSLIIPSIVITKTLLVRYYCFIVLV